jgi:hypothetical protein
MVQTRLGQNFSFLEPTDRPTVDAVADEPETPAEAQARSLAISRAAAVLRVQQFNLSNIADPVLRVLLFDLMVATGIKEPP